VVFLAALGFAAGAFGKHFRLYSILTFMILLLFGVLTFKEAPGVATNQATPFIGVWERINVGVFLVWVIILGSLLLRTDTQTVETTGHNKDSKYYSA